MNDFNRIKINKSTGEKYREQYLNSIEKILARKTSEAIEKRNAFVSPEKMNGSREEYRKKYYEMLGWPLNEYKSNFKPRYNKELVQELDFVKIYRLSIETLPDMWFNGLIYEPANVKNNAPLVVMNPGGGYCAEELMAYEDFDAGQIKNIGEKFLDAGCVIYAPQLFLWDNAEPHIEHPEYRQFIDVRLKATGGSIAALEIFNVRRGIDYFIGNEDIDENKIGMVGLSYGGFYTIYIAAAEPRIKAAFSSCFCCDRFGNDNKSGQCRSDWLWQDSAHTFFDAEVAALIAPRALYLEGTDDDMFPEDLVIKEHERVKSFYKAAGAENMLKTVIESGKHEIVNADDGAEFVIRNIIK